MVNFKHFSLGFQEWRKCEKQFEVEKIVGHTFFQHVYHPEFNVDDG